MDIFHHKKPDIETAYELYADMLYRISFAQLGSDADAQDVVQDVFMKYMTKAPVFFNHEHQKAWFIRVTVNHCHDYARRANVRKIVPLEEADYVTVESQEHLDSLMDILSCIPEKYKDTVILHYLEGFSVHETAKILGISLSATKMRLSRARERLQALRKEEDDVSREGS